MNDALSIAICFLPKILVKFVYVCDQGDKRPY